MDGLVNKGLVDIGQMVELLTVGPADVLGIDKGTLDIGADADITIIDPEMVKVVEPSKFYSKGKNTPIKGRTFKGWPWMTIVNGKIVANEGKIVEE
jgi:dihydroorotase